MEVYALSLTFFPSPFLLLHIEKEPIKQLAKKMQDRKKKAKLSVLNFMDRRQSRVSSMSIYFEKKECDVFSDSLWIKKIGESRGTSN